MVTNTEWGMSWELMMILGKKVLKKMENIEKTTKNPLFSVRKMTQHEIDRLEKLEKTGFTKVISVEGFDSIKSLATNDREKALDEFLQDYDKKVFMKFKNYVKNREYLRFISNEGQGYYTIAMIVSLNDESHLVLYEDVEFQTLKKMDLYEFINEFTISMCK